MSIRPTFKLTEKTDFEDPYDLRRSRSLRARIRLRLKKLRYPKLVYGSFLLITLGICWYLNLLWHGRSSLTIIRSSYEDDEQVKVKNSSGPRLEADVEKRDAVVAAFKHAWSAYERDAFGYDEYHPISKRGENLARSGGIGYTVADAIDTIYLMGLEPEYQRARTWIADELDFDQTGTFSTFETSIRVLGGLLSTYHLTSDPLFLSRSTDLASRLLSAFTTPSGLPLPSVNLNSRTGVPEKGGFADRISTAEAATLQLEFRYLAEVSGNRTFWERVERVMEVVDEALGGRGAGGLVPIFMSATTGTFKTSEIRLGSRGDSYYEYLLKQYLQTGKTESVYREMYQEAMQGIHTHLVHHTPRKQMTYIAELHPKDFYSNINLDSLDGFKVHHKQDHLVCFLAGSLMLGAVTTGAVGGAAGGAIGSGGGNEGAVSIPPKANELTEVGKRDWETGVELLETCMGTHETATGLAPEIAMFYTSEEEAEAAGVVEGRTRDWYIKNSRPGGPSSYDARYMLRPETVESLYIAHRLTGDPRYRDYAWGIFSSIEKHAKIPGGGYATVLDVDTVPVRLDDKQETFFLSETLKYLYLIFCDSSVLPLHEMVFNTEAHPLPVFVPTIKPGFTARSR
ncbi:glycoside hydrolase family 47 protein [Collybiopsis luxurians FD-317 M1]|uniref:alpha-1,2-Mannosidase n=1 Tax=Collybiopsis luxurians FD-317 M1 TaxID=944289 RepID=A0A0D0CHE6_9AGAR|nr:glycoside hydrolase family 47 protein [Collybiopsis luxurians FD-317 M1]